MNSEYLLRKNIIREKLFVAGGVNFHFNFGVAHNSLSSSEEIFTFYGLGVGINMSNSLACVMSYYYQQNSKYLFREYENIYKLGDIIKWGFDLTF